MVITVCAWCKEKIKIHSSWQVLDRASDLDDLVTDTDVVSHGVCPECCAAMHQDMSQVAQNQTSRISI
ncbi:MAG: hypothetical protein AAF629_01405 [Chloroflexota bacterium]